MPAHGYLPRIEDTPPDRELAFWIQFAETWKDLAELCDDQHRRLGCLDRARICLGRATIVRQKLERVAGHQKPR